MQSKLSYYFLLLLCISFITPAHAGDRKTCHSDAPGENIYKHYTGTIGGKHVVLDLRYGFCGASNYGGSYVYFTEGNETKCLAIYEPKSFAHTAELHAEEHPINYRWGIPEEVVFPSWTFVIKDDQLTGKWTSADKKTTAEINLVEDYSKTIRLDLMSYRDSATTMQPGRPMRTAYFYYLGVKPTANANKAINYLINGELLKLTEVDQQGVTNIEIMPATIAQQRFGEFTTAYGLMPEDTAQAEWHRGNFSYSALVFPVYNDNGLLSLELVNTGKKPSRYVCISLGTNKSLKLADIVTTNNGILKAQIIKEYRNTADSETLKAFPVSNIEVPENFMFTGKGIIFCYPYDTGKGYTAEARVFLSFKQLGTTMKKEFRMLMGSN